MNAFDTVKQYLLDLDYNILETDLEEELFVVEKEEAGIHRLHIDCEDPILIIEQPLFTISEKNTDLFFELLKKNRDIVHGAFAITDENIVIFRDTLQLENLDMNELEGTLESLELLLAEYGNRLIELSNASHA